LSSLHQRLLIGGQETPAADPWRINWHWETLGRAYGFVVCVLRVVVFPM
jgi:hypothetical protein